MGFNPRLSPYSVSWHFAADPAADVTFHAFRFPAAGQVLDAWASNDAAIATATNTLTLRLAKYSSAATPVVQGTLGSWAAGSTWAADVPRQMTKTAFGSTARFVAGEHVYLIYDEATTGTWTRMSVNMDYVIGYTN